MLQILRGIRLYSLLNFQFLSKKQVMLTVGVICDIFYLTCSLGAKALLCNPLRVVASWCWSPVLSCMLLLWIQWEGQTYHPGLCQVVTMLSHCSQEPWLLQSRRVAGALSCIWFTWFIIKVVLLKVHTIEFVLETINSGIHVSQCI